MFKRQQDQRRNPLNELQAHTLSQPKQTMQADYKQNSLLNESSSRAVQDQGLGFRKQSSGAGILSPRDKLQQALGQLPKDGLFTTARFNNALSP